LQAPFDSNADSNPELALQQDIRGPGRLPVHRWRGVAIKVQGDGDGSVAQHIGHQLGVDPLPQQQRGGAMPEIVKTDVGKASPLQEPPEGPPDKVSGLYGVAYSVGEDEAATRVSLGRSNPSLGLAKASSPHSRGDTSGGRTHAQRSEPGNARLT